MRGTTHCACCILHKTNLEPLARFRLRRVNLEKPLNDQDLINLLDELGIAHSTAEHPPLRTVEDSKRLRGTLNGAHVKNLFLRDKKGGFWLVVAQEDTKIDLRQVASALGAPRLSFAKTEDLAALLGIIPGAVSPLALINDANAQVRVVLERRLLDCSLLNFHPLRNDRTTTIATPDLLKFLDAIQHPAHWIGLPEAVTATAQEPNAIPKE